ncbi:NAD(P)/FAD-dependent oxidoreductase [Caldisalinibacter kiritimatiensis]|uniref:SoxB-like sarcosine oxidase, subunit beta n=1 Tax=Caldisalinibacter kiritimatiensis TaxID=1304284 RepID=R1CSW0_9FIRM|nr:FAD-binding oxidoreductase [Caldisalinibacter kiritimatiensis]EOD01741.1 SoxB-like sarcosine oxidase, subunit beta [Caldisalinibacter kiritimatiensis]
MIKSAEVVIIGGGISGCSIAYNLAKKGVKNVVILEKEYLASGSTGRCGAGVRQQWGREMNCRLAMESIKFFENAKEELEYDKDIEFKQEGYLIVATTEKEDNQFKENVKLQRKLGIPVEYLTPKEAKKIVPHLNTKGVISATFCSKDGHLNPFLMTDAYAKAAKRLGVKIYTYTEVIGIKVKNNKIYGVKTNKGFISTRIVINAAGGYSKQIGKMVGIDLPVYSERHQILVTEPVKPIQGPMVISFSLNIYCQQTPHGSFIMGRGDSNEPKDLRVTSSWNFMEQMTTTAINLLPPLGELRIIRQWAGLYNITPDKHPILGPVKEVDGFYLAIGFSGHGFMLAPMTGLLLAEQIIGEKTTIPIDKLDKDRFERGEMVLEPSVV